MIASIILGKLWLSDWHHCCCFSLSDVDIAAHLHLRPFHCFLSVSSAIGSRQEVMLHNPSERDMAFPHCLFIFLLLVSFSVLKFTTLSSHPPPCLYHYHHGIIFSASCPLLCLLLPSTSNIIILSQSIQVNWMIFVRKLQKNSWTYNSNLQHIHFAPM